MRKLLAFLKRHSHLSRALGILLIVLICANIVAVILDSYVELHGRYATFFSTFELFSIAVFTVEYLLRVLASPYLDGDTYSTRSLVRYLVSPMALIDLLAILPFYLPFLFAFDLRMIRIFRVFRLIRILKIKRYSKSLDLIVSVLKAKRTDLFLVFVITSILLLLCGSTMYFLENEVQPDIFPNILDSTLWSLKTMVFLGYDAPPMTIPGKFTGLLITLLGLGWIALPISVVSSGFMEAIERHRKDSAK